MKAQNWLVLSSAALLSTSALLSSSVNALELARTDDASLLFGGWIGLEYSHNFDDSLFDLGFNSGASRIFFAGTNRISDELLAYGKLEYAVGFSDIDDNEFTTRLGFIGLTTEYGSVEIGKVWSPFYDVAMYSDTAMSNKDAATGAFFSPVSEVAGFGRADNSVKYINQFALGEGDLLFSAIVGDQSDKKIGSQVTVGATYGFSLRYANGPFQVGVAHQGAQADGLQGSDDHINATIVGAFFNNADWLIGANYTLGTNNQNETGAMPTSDRLVDSDGIEGFVHYRFADSWKAYVGYNSLETDSDLYTTEFANVGLLKNFNKKIALYSEYRMDLDSTENSLFYGDAFSIGIIYFFSDYPHYF